MRRSVLAAVALVLLAATAAACQDSGAADSKTGGRAGPVVLTLADGYDDPSFEPAVAYFAKRVEQLSDGQLEVEDHRLWGELAPDFEQQIVGDVASGEADLGWVGTRVFDTLGVSAFQALTAPMLVDSYPLEDAVIASEIPGQMLESLDALDVTGLAVLGDGLRKPIAQDAPLVSVADWQGLTFNVFRSEAQMDAVAATGATPTDVLAGDPAYVAAERNLRIYQNNYASTYRYVTANVNLWPQTVALIGNPEKLAQLTDEQRGWVRRAAEEASAGSTALFDHDQEILVSTCAKGARFAVASDDQLAELRSAFDGVYAAIEQDPESQEYVRQIQAMKAELAPVPPLEVPSNCTPTADDATGDDPLQGQWETEALTEGQIVQAFVAASGTEADGHDFYAAQFTGDVGDNVRFRLDFQHGSLDQYQSGDGGTFGHGDHRTYRTDGSVLTFEDPGCESHFTVDLEDDTLLLSPSDMCQNEDTPYATTIYATFPYTRVP